MSQVSNEPVQSQLQALTVEELKSRRDELLLFHEVQALESLTREKAEQNISLTMEAFNHYMDYSNFVDPREWMTDSFGYPLGAFALTQTRDDGRNRPFIETEQDLIEMRGVARMLAELNPYITGVIEDLTNYVIGTGFTYTSIGRRNRNANPQLVNLVQDILDEFEELNLWSGNLEREVIRRGIRDGEAPICLYHVGHGQTEARIIEPECITEPKGAVHDLEEFLAFKFPAMMNWDSDPSSWSFGVHTPERDVEKHLGYFAEWNGSGSDWDYIHAKDLVFIKSNVDRNVKRGLSDLYPVGGFSDRVMKLARNIMSGASVQAGIAFIEEMEAGINPSELKGLVDAAAEYQKRRNTPSGGTSFLDVSFIEEATKLTIPKDRKYHAGPMGNNNAPIYLEALQGGLRAIGVRWSMPEYMVSGDASNGNYASSVEAGTPFVKACEARQHFYISHFKDLKWRVIRNAFMAGRFQGFANSFQEIKRQIEINVAAPDVETRDPTAETQRRKMLWECGGLSLKTWMAEEGYDHKQELENIRADKEDNFEPTPNVIPGSAAVPAAMGAPDSTFQEISQQETTQFESVAKSMLAEIWENYP